MAELDLTNILESSIATPASGVTAVFIDSLNKQLKTKDDAGFVRGYTSNFSVTSQAPAATTRTYIAGSALAIPSNKLQIGTCFRWTFDITKTAAGVAASTIDICFGTAGTTADTARVSFTKPAGTAAVDQGIVVITCVIRSIGASGVASGLFKMEHVGNTVGHAVVPSVTLTTISAGFDMTVANLIAGVCITTGASDAITIQQVVSEAWNL